MFGSEKSRTRRAEIRKNLPRNDWRDWQKLKARGVPESLAIAFGFFLIASTILLLRQEVSPFRPGQWLHHDVVSRVRFVFKDKERLEMKQHEAAARQPRVYSKNNKCEDVWGDLEREMLQLPDRVTSAPADKLPEDIAGLFDSGSATLLRKYAGADSRDDYVHRVTDYINDLRNYRLSYGGKMWPIVVLPDKERKEDKNLNRIVRVSGEGDLPADRTFTVYGNDLRAQMSEAAQRQFPLALQPKMVAFTLAKLQPTHEYDDAATVEAREKARDNVPESEGNVVYGPDEVLVPASTRAGIDLNEWRLLRAEHQAYVASLKVSRWRAHIGAAGLVFVITCVLSLYLSTYQPRVMTNHARALAIAALLLSMLLLNQIAAIGNGPLYLVGTAPTLMVAMILAIGYDQRTAFSVAMLHGVLATLALDQGIAFFMVICFGIAACCFCLDDIRTRSKLVEVGGAAAGAMVLAAVAAGFVAFDPWSYIQQNVLWAGASGMAVGFVALGILPFIERAFKITTSMTLLELADPSQPLLRRLQVEAQGTYNHSLQVGVVAEAAAEAIGADALLCRVASYYHDVGKINKPEYFVENQTGGESRHINLTPSVSRLIIIGHVKDGVALAKEYRLPAAIVPFIEQHHGTTLVEYFYRQACNQKGLLDPNGPKIEDHDYRYEGPKPKTREAAIVMMADCVESACRALEEPTASRVETLVQQLAMKRLLDGQFDDCDLTMRDLEKICKTMMKTIMAIYHGRIAYPPPPPEEAAAEQLSMRMA